MATTNKIKTQNHPFSGGPAKHGLDEAIPTNLKKDNKNMQPKILSVIFVEQARGGTFTLALWKKMESLAPLLGHK